MTTSKIKSSETVHQPEMRLVEQNATKTHVIFSENYKNGLLVEDHISKKKKLSAKIQGEYKDSQKLPAGLIKQQKSQEKPLKSEKQASEQNGSLIEKLIKEIPLVQREMRSAPVSLSVQLKTESTLALTKSTKNDIDSSFIASASSSALVRLKDTRKVPKPKWHAPWKLARVISGHLGPVRAVATDIGNEWFATGAGDRIIKIWDMASGTLKLSLTGHISPVRGIAISPRHPYLFSCGEDKMIKCWDLEQNKVVRHYHGHLSGIYSVALHPTLDLLVTTSRDSTARVWDMRTKAQVFAFTGHKGAVYQSICQETDPQIVTCSADATIRLWDLAAGKTITTLTHHKKAVRSIVANPNEFTFASASPDNIKQWKFPQGQMIQNLSGHSSIVNSLSMNQDNVLFSGGDNGSMYFWDYKSGYNFQIAETIAQSGSLDSEAGIYCSTFDRTGTRLITGEADKSIKIWKEDENATPETHPIDWKPSFFSGSN